MGIREEVGGARQFVTDRRVEALLVGEARRRAVTRAFGILHEIRAAYDLRYAS